MRSQQPILLILILVKSSPPQLSLARTCHIWEKYFLEIFLISSTGCGCTFGKPRLYWQFQCLGTKTVFLWINGPIKRWEPQAGPHTKGVHCSYDCSCCSAQLIPPYLNFSLYWWSMKISLQPKHKKLCMFR